MAAAIRLHQEAEPVQAEDALAGAEDLEQAAAGTGENHVGQARTMRTDYPAGMACHGDLLRQGEGRPFPQLEAVGRNNIEHRLQIGRASIRESVCTYE